MKLANKKKNSKIIFLGGSGYLKEHTIDESDVARNFFIDINFDLKRVIFVNDTRNTIENLIPKTLSKILETQKSETN